MLSNIVMKNLLFAAWKNSSRPKIGQFEYQVKLQVTVFDLAPAEEKITLALMPVCSPDESYSFLSTKVSGQRLSELFTRRLADVLVGTGKFAVLDRENLAAFAYEKDALLSLNAPVKSQANLAETAGADYLLLGTITQANISVTKKELEAANYTVRKYKARFLLDYRIVDCATKEIVAASQAKDYLENEDVRDLADEADQDEWNTAQITNEFLRLMATRTARQLMRDLEPVKVAAVRNDEVILNQGADYLSKGVVLDVLGHRAEVRDPGTGELLGRPEYNIARIRVRYVTDELAVCDLVDGELSAISEGSLCRVHPPNKKQSPGAKPDLKRTEQGGVKLPFD